MSVRSCLAALVVLSSTPAFAAQPPEVVQSPEEAQLERIAEAPVPVFEEPTPEQIAAAIVEFDKSLNYQQGEISVADGKAVLSVPASFRFLGAADARMVLEGPWGNPPDESVLGMLVPADISPLDPERGWAVVVTYQDSGHVDDADAASINYDELLTSMQTAQMEDNVQRQASGFPAVTLRGWAEPPHYDSANHKLYWAMQAGFTDAEEDSLNYAVRVLGRAGVLELNAIATPERLAEIKPAMEEVVTFAKFTAGNTYADFDASTDKLATYGIGGLIAGGLAAKTGLLKGLWLALVAGKKFVVIGLVAVGAFIGRLFVRKRES